ncbi:hypothetical protein I3760_10G099900 [Carya illinoinensis]|nr:hypothetical protein I3760_10G099900 [Carya illinoinensis]
MGLGFGGGVHRPEGDRTEGVVSTTLAGGGRSGRVKGSATGRRKGAARAQSNFDPPIPNSIPNFIPNSSRINPSDDSLSFYFLHPSDNPVLYWFLKSSLERITEHGVALSLLHLHLLYFTSAFEIWEELKIRYLRSDGPRVFTLEKSLSSISQASKSVTEYFSEFKTLWDEYISYCPFPVCCCGNIERCSCDILKNLAECQQADYVMKFLVGLHDSYSALRSQLLLQSPLPSMSKVFSLLLQEESQRSLSNTIGISLDSHAMFATQSQRQHSLNVSKFQKPRGKTDAICSHCGYSGHLVDKCFQLIGYPPGWKGLRGKRSIFAYPRNETSWLPIANMFHLWSRMQVIPTPFSLKSKFKT